MPGSKRYAFGEFVLETAQQRVLRRAGPELGLPPKMFKALLLFVEHAGELLDKDTLIQALWPGLVVDENNLSQVVSGLRRALGDDAQGSRFIQTVPRRGFRFIATVTALANEEPAPPAPDPIVSADAAVPGVAPRRGWLRVALAGGALAGLGALGWRVWSPTMAPRVTPGPAATLAVLPFKPLTAEGRDELLELGMADSLIARLSMVPGLVVRSTGSVLRYAGPAQDPLRAARELDVTWVVDGSLQRRDDRLRVSARLLRATDGTAAWSGSFDEKFAGVFDMQDQISDRVAQALVPALHSGAVGVNAHFAEPGGTRSTEAYQLYLTAAWRAQDMRSESAGKAVKLLEQALTIDPNYALAWALLAWVHRRKLYRNDSLPAEVFTAADAALKRALALAPELAQARGGQGFRRYMFDFDWPGAEQEFRRALAANANEVSAQFGFALLSFTTGHIDEGFGRLRLACELDPMSPVLAAVEASFLVERGRLAEAGERLNRIFDIAPDHGLATMTLGLLLWAEQQPEKAIAALRRAVELNDGASRPKAVLGMHLAALGQTAEARTILDALHAQARTRWLPPTSLATVHAALGEHEAALAALEQALRDRDTRLIYAKDDPGWKPLRATPRFAALLKQLGLDRYGPGLSPV